MADLVRADIQRPDHPPDPAFRLAEHFNQAHQHQQPHARFDDPQDRHRMPRGHMNQTPYPAERVNLGAGLDPQSDADQSRRSHRDNT
jgi:hypothetical protein